MKDKVEIKKQIMDQLHAMQQRIDGLDITIAEQKKTEEALRKNETTLRLVTENMSDLFVIIDRSGFFQYVSPSHQAIIGYTPDYLMGKLAFDFVHPDDQERVVAAYARAMATGMPDKAEYLFRHEDGHYMWVESIGRAILDSSGAVTGGAISTRDNTERRRIEEALRESEEKYRRIIDKTKDVIYSYLPDGTISFISESISQLGFTPDEMTGKHVLEFIHEADFERVQEAFLKSLEGQHGTIQFRARRKDGGFEWMEEMSESVMVDGKLVHINGIIRNITRRREAEEALRDSENRYRIIFETTGAATVIIEDDGTIRLANKEVEIFSGYSKEEIEGRMRWQDLVPPEDINTLTGYGELRRSDPDAAPRQYEARIIDRAGNMKHFLTTASRVPETAMTIVSLVDISELKRAAVALKESEQKYRLLMEKSNEAIIIAQDGVIKFPNPKLISLLGYSEEELIRMPFTDLIHPDDRQMVLERYEKRLQGETPPTHYLFKALNKWGEELLAEMNPIPVMWDEKPAVLCFIRDITQEKKIEEHLVHAQKMEALGTLSGGIAHDFNNLLMGIQGHTSMMLLDTEPYHPHFEKLKDIEDQIRGGANLTRQLLGLASAGKYEVRPTDTNEVLEKTAIMFGRTRKEIAIFKKYEAGLWTAEVDRGQIEQVLLNLYVNAWQAMPEGGELYLASHNITLDDAFLKPYGLKGGRYVRLSVSDTGTGMDERTKERIFDPFFTTKEMGRGTGLGLASAYGIVKNHGGFINVFSEKGKGSSFHIYLPASDMEAEKQAPQSEDLSKGIETILVVDDEKINITVTTQMLGALGYRTMTARSGQEAVYQYKENNQEIDLVILDMVMPGMSGGETFDILKEINPDVKVILSSGYSLDGQASNIVARGCKAFMQKPVTLGVLSQRVRTVLDETS